MDSFILLLYIKFLVLVIVSQSGRLLVFSEANVIKHFYKLLTSPTIDNSYNNNINIMTFNALKT